MARVLSFLKRYFSNYYTLLRSDLAARAAPLDPRLEFLTNLLCSNEFNPIKLFYIVDKRQVQNTRDMSEIIPVQV